MMIKWIAIGITSLGMIVGGIFYVEDRYFHTDEAEAMNTTIVAKIVKVKKEVSKETLETFKDVQQSFQSMQRNNDTNHLESLKDRKYLLEKQLAADPNNELLKEKTNVMRRQIKRLEDKLYK